MNIVTKETPFPHFNTNEVKDIAVKKPFLKDPGSALTHFIAMVLAIAGTAPIIVRAALTGNAVNLISVSIFMASMILLYGASSTYHTFDISEHTNKILKKIDHCMIFVLIAGSYTPICLIALHNISGYMLFAVVWAIAIMGILFKLCWVTCPKWISSVLYIAMGWVCLLALPEIMNALHPEAFMLLLTGGIIYTIGGIIYAIKMPHFNAKHKNFGTHEIFHVFVMGGSLFHYLLMLLYVSVM